MIILKWNIYKNGERVKRNILHLLGFHDSIITLR
jgi:hypothetical protein